MGLPDFTGGVPYPSECKMYKPEITIAPGKSDFVMEIYGAGTLFETKIRFLNPSGGNISGDIAIRYYLDGPDFDTYFLSYFSGYNQQYGFTTFFVEWDQLPTSFGLRLRQLLEFNQSFKLEVDNPASAPGDVKVVVHCVYILKV